MTVDEPLSLDQLVDHFCNDMDHLVVKHNKVDNKSEPPFIFPPLKASKYLAPLSKEDADFLLDCFEPYQDSPDLLNFVTGPASSKMTVKMVNSKVKLTPKD